jgi:hypothetical protein
MSFRKWGCATTLHRTRLARGPRLMSRRRAPSLRTRHPWPSGCLSRQRRGGLRAGDSESEVAGGPRAFDDRVAVMVASAASSQPGLATRRRPGRGTAPQQPGSIMGRCQWRRPGVPGHWQPDLRLHADPALCRLTAPVLLRAPSGRRVHARRFRPDEHYNAPPSTSSMAATSVTDAAGSQ